ncbi:NAD(P)-dependent oxidoreductase [Amycolatopsis sp. NPDC051903]|uniref:NAD(P)-dependent oxidoreductase n=1 Tax=Amycolatopsis sp. NPDC051903 TaxID=3363936 RepID=UPI0037A1F36B
MELSVLGLGRMGSALAGAFLAAGYDVAVWNRSPRKVAAPAARGAKPLADPADATGLVVTCLSTYDDQRPVLERLPAGTTLVSLTSGTPAEARATAEFASAHGITYVDGVVLAVPQAVGGPSARLLYGGSAAAFAEHREVLETLGAATFLGPDAGLPAVHDLALLGIMWTTMAGYLQALALVGGAGVQPAQFAPFAAGWLDVVTANLPRLADAVASGDHRTEVSTVDLNAAGLAHLVAAVREQGLDDGVPAAVRGLFDRAVARGHGEHGVSSVVEVIKQPQPR